MCGNDLFDMLRALYSCARRSNKWWHKILFFMIDAIAINCYIIYCEYYPGKYKERADFIEDLILDLAGLDRDGAAVSTVSTVSPMNKTRYRSSRSIPLVDRQTGFHYPDEEPGTSSKCAYCKHYCNDPSRDTQLFCSDCSSSMQKGKVYLHAQCWKKWHSEEPID